MEDGVKKKFFCSFDGCDMTFDRPSRLEWHIRNHTGEVIVTLLI